LMGLVLGPLAENRLFLSIDAYGAAWLWRPGVLLLAAAVGAGLIISGGRRLPHRRTATSGRSRAETVFAGGLIVVLAAAFVVASNYAGRSSILPRAVAAVTIVCVIAMLLTSRTGQSLTAAGDHSGRRVLGWLLAFIVCIWALGFVAGAPLAIFGYFVVATRERWTFALLSSAAMFVFLYGVLARLLAVPLPLGALLTAAGR
jgi:putative tricarboxylic transport membrane protein